MLWRIDQREYNKEIEYSINELKRIYRIEIEDIKDTNTNDNEYLVYTKRLNNRTDTILENLLDREVFYMRIENTSLDYIPGDSILIRVTNSDIEVKRILNTLGIEGEERISFRRIMNRNNKEVFSFSGKVYDYFKRYFDFTSIPSKSMLFRMSKYAGNKERNRLLYLCTREGMNDYFNLKYNWNSITDILEELSVKIPLVDLLEVCTELKPRAFSMINKNNQDIEFICKVITATNKNRYRFGHVSQYILERHISSKDIISIMDRGDKDDVSDIDDISDIDDVIDKDDVIDRIEKIRIERVSDDKISNRASNGKLYSIGLKENRLMRMRKGNGLLVGIGTGVAPFISFLRNKDPEQEFTLFYGCRNKEENILLALGIVQEEEDTEYKGALKYKYNTDTIYIIYSRENESIRLPEFFKMHTEKIDPLITRLSQVYICGNQMVQNSLLEYFKERQSNLLVYLDEWL
ncbi:methionine synthase reductase [Nematocida sp. AWRm80]|nr:methionine synthase reductase [Nematocida sp. AWRm80]